MRLLLLSPNRYTKRARRSVATALTLLTITGGAALAAAPAHAAVTRYRAGSSTDVSRSTWNGPAFTFNGDGAIVTDTMGKAITAITGGTGTMDVVVLADSVATSGSSTPECDVIMTLSGINSCTTYILTSASDGDDPQVNADVRNAEFVYFAGGNQCAYAAWKGTALQASVQSVVAKGGGSGGGSAGTHINSSIVYDACGNGGSGTDSATALANPYDSSITFTTGMFTWPNYGDTINDSHFLTRDRMGRTMAFVARALQDGLTVSGKAWGVGIEQGGGSLFMDKNGLATLSGSDAWIVLGDHTPEVAQPDTPLTFSNYKIWHLTAGDTFDFKDRPTCGYYTKSVTAGTPDADLYSGTPVTDCGGGGGGGGGNTVTVANPGTQTTTTGTAVDLRITAADSASGQTLAYAATGLPAGLSITTAGHITGSPTAAGTASVTVTATDATGAHGSTTFTWNVSTAGSGSTFGESEPNDSPGGANDISALAFPVTVIGSMGRTSDRDYYRFTANAGQQISIDCAVPAAYDADLYLLNSSGTDLARSVNDGYGVSEAFDYTATASGTYYADVEDYAGSGTATYSCTITKH